MFKVTNTNTEGLGKDFIGRYNGQDYLFPSPVDGKKQPVYIDDDAASHIFGIGNFDKAKILVRHGWATYNTSLQAGMDILNKFIFEQPEIAYDAPMALIDDHGPAPVVQDSPGEPADDGELGDVAEQSPETPPAAVVAETVNKAAAAVSAGRRTPAA